MLNGLFQDAIVQILNQSVNLTISGSISFPFFKLSLTWKCFSSQLAKAWELRTVVSSESSLFFFR